MLEAEPSSWHNGRSSRSLASVPCRRPRGTHAPIVHVVRCAGLSRKCRGETDAWLAWSTMVWRLSGAVGQGPAADGTEVIYPRIERSLADLTASTVGSVQHFPGERHEGFSSEVTGSRHIKRQATMRCRNGRDPSSSKAISQPASRTRKGPKATAHQLIARRGRHNIVDVLSAELEKK